MEDLLGRFGMYDILVRMMSGSLTILGIHFFGLENILKCKSDFPVLIFLIASYGIGLILEEVSYVMETITNTRQKIEESVCKENDYKKYDFKKCKAALIRHEKEMIAEEPLAHIVMASALRNAYFVILIWKTGSILLHADNRTIVSIKQMAVLVFIIVILHVRQKHYCHRRVERIFDYCIAKGYDNIGNTDEQNYQDEKERCEK